MNDSSQGNGKGAPKKTADSFEKLLEESMAAQGEVSLGEKVQAKIFNIGKDYVFLELGSREEGLLPREEVMEDDNLTVAVGDTISVFTLKIRDGAVLCGLRVGSGGAVEKSADKDMALASLRDAFESAMPVEGTVKEVIKGGFSVTVMTMRAFCPISQIDDSYCETPEEHLGHSYDFLVIELDGSGRNIVLSRRRLLEQATEELARDLWKSIEVGAVYSGTVSSLKSYGAFVDIGGIEGLLHVSEIDYERVDDPFDAFKKGEKIRVIVKSIDHEKKRVSLSRKALLEDPWIDAAETIKERAVMTGEVVRLAPFGAFVELKKGVEGLVHISEMGKGKRLRTPREAAREGDKVQVRVLSVDLEKRRISLSMDDLDDENALDDEALKAQRRERDNSGKGLGTFGDLFKDKLKK